MQPDTLFWIASQTKPITATALMMLVEESKVHLDDPAEDYLPLLKDPWVIAEQDDSHRLLIKADRKVTVRDLLNHTSGLPFKSGMEEPTLDSLPLSEAVRSYAMTPLQSQPGTRYDYSNIGINIAGRIIEVVSGMPYETFMQQHLFDPLGMTDTTFWPTAEQTRRLAKSYRPNAARDGFDAFPISQLTYPLDNRLTRYPMPAGGLFSTAPDVIRFCQMILNGGKVGPTTYLSEASIAEMTRKQTGGSIEESYGLGWGVGAGSFGHGGAQATNMSIHPARGLITTFLVQHEGYLLDGDKSQEAFIAAALTE
ncbi:MAG: serine hydrolase domain-containing protein [Janthinobacterium lividum]